MEYARWRHAVFALRRLGLVSTSVVAVRLLAGGRPAATPFSCFAKKRKQKKATQFAALRVPACASQKMGNEANSPAAQTASFLIHFLPCTSGSAADGERQHIHSVTCASPSARVGTISAA
jgi:hypothetical protein